MDAERLAQLTTEIDGLSQELQKILAQAEQLTRALIDQRDVIQALQKALAYWMPSVFDERSAHDAYLLVGYEGDTEAECWGDQMCAALRQNTSVPIAR
jgi:hypothetical protein